jgi:AcrR family transcriptional regulator
MHSNDIKPKAAPRLSREDRRLQTRTALREAALREFALCGVAGTSAERIAESAGFTRGAFYANFENKQVLLLDLISEHVNAEQASWLELANSQLDLDTLLRTLDERTDRYDPDGLWSLIGSETYLYALRDPDFAVRYREFHEAIRDTFVRIIGSLMKRAGKVSPVPLDEFCDAMLTLNRSVRLSSSDRPEQPPEPFSRHLLMNLVRGLIAIAPAAPVAPPAAP